MTDLRAPLFDLRDQAVDEAAEARDELAEQLAHDEVLANRENYDARTS